MLLKRSDNNQSMNRRTVIGTCCLELWPATVARHCPLRLTA